MTHVLRRSLVRALAALSCAFALLPGPVAAGEGTVGALYEPGDQAQWVFELAGEPFGSQLFVYDGPESLAGRPAHRFRSWVQLDSLMGQPAQRITSELWVDDGGHPLRHVFALAMGENVSGVELTFDGGQADARILQPPAPRELSFPVPADLFIQANNVMGPFELLLALDLPREGQPLSLTLLSTNALRAFPYECTWVEDATQTVAGEQRLVHVLQDTLGETLTVDADGRLLRLEVPQQQLVVRRVDDADMQRFERFELSVAPVEDDGAWDAFDVEEVTITHDDVSLAGCITRPAGVEGPLPGVFFISGSGLQDRHGFSSGVDVGTREVLDRLTTAGFAVLRVDDRGAGASSGPTAGIGYDDLLADARACLEFLLAHDGVDAERVALIGHSEGGVTAPLLAAERVEVAAVVLMAAAGRPLTEVIMEQNAQVLDLQGMQGEERAALLAEIRGVLDELIGDGELSDADLPEDYRSMLAMRAWLQQHARQDPLANLRRVHCPVLLLQGELDFQVSAERDAPLLEAALAESGHDDFQLVVFEHLDHLFKRARGETSSFSDYFTDRPVDELFLATLESWLVERLQSAD